jgi:hypothetical protein
VWWSRWVVYLISTLLIVYSAWYSWSLFQGRWPDESGSRSFVYFLPGALLRAEQRTARPLNGGVMRRGELVTTACAVDPVSNVGA